jgi:hypothetical protein
VKEQTVKLSFVPRPHQREAHKKRKRFSVLVWHRRAGKSVFCIIELLIAAFTCTKQAGRFAYVAPFYGQAKAVAWEYLKRFAREIPGVVIKEGELCVLLPNGAMIKLYGADNPDTLRGLYFDGIVLDEVADMKPNVWGEIIRPALTDRQGWAIFIGTPKGLNLFSDLYNHAVRDPDWYPDMKRVGDTKAIPDAEVEQARKEMAPPIFAQEFECDFSAAVINAFLPLDLVLKAQKRMLPRDAYFYAAMLLGNDVARFGDDRSVIFPRQGLQAFKPYVFRGLDTQQMAGQVMHYLDQDKADMVFIDGIGVGSGVVDRLRTIGCNRFLEVNSGTKAINPKYKNLRAEMAAKAKAWLESGGCLPEFEGLAADFCAPMYWFDTADRLQIESKEQMKARGLPSCDLFDAFCLTFAVPVEKRNELQKHERNKPNTVKTEYNLLP